jgi:DNA sulfur modification protein DndD
MRLLNLTIHNVGVFRGRHEFDFSPIPKPDGTRRHLTVITGANGVGKSTVFQSLNLALHGSLAISSRMTRQAYSQFLWGRLHRYEGTGLPVPEEEAGIKLSFHYTQSGQPLHVQVNRRWKGSNKAVQESIKVLRNGAPPEVDPADYQTWINELIPPGLGPICFFDAEQLDALASLEQQKALLGHTLRGLLGLDLVEQLQADLDRYTLLKSGGGRGLDRLRKDLQKSQSALKKCEAKLSRLQADYDSLAAKENQIEAELAERERRLAAKGGAYAARRPLLEERLKVVFSEIESISEDLRSQSAELLPFSLAPELCRYLSERLRRETEVRQQQSANKLWRERTSHYRKLLRGDEVWHGINIAPGDRKTLAERLVKEFRALDSKAEDGEVFVHNLADAEKEKLQDWISQAVYTVPHHVRAQAERLRALQNEQHQIDSDLQRAPDEEELIPIHAEITQLREASIDNRRERDNLKEKLGALQFQRDEFAREVLRAKEKLVKAQGFKQQLALAERSKKILRAYAESLTNERLRNLERALVESFNEICRKERLLDRAVISPGDFSVRLHGSSGDELNLAEFSAGERELYALALISSLRKVSGRRLPVVIDTPLARLDEIHRRRFLHDYVPAVSDQVVLIATEAELDEHLLVEAEPYIARVYRLNYDQTRKESYATMSEAPPAPAPGMTLPEISREKAHVS